MIVLFAVKPGLHQFNARCVRACNCSCGWTGEGGDKNGCPEGDECRAVLVTQDTSYRQTQTTTIPPKFLHEQLLSPSADLTHLVLYIYSFLSDSLSLSSLQYLCKTLAGKGNQNTLPDAAVTGIESVMDRKLQPSYFSASVKGVMG